MSITALPGLECGSHFVPMPSGSVCDKVVVTGGGLTGTEMTYDIYGDKVHLIGDSRQVANLLNALDKNRTKMYTKRRI